jgi:glycosyltransferase involved in cell wall biosynthesis
MDKYPFISIIIPTLNEEKYLPTCLESIRAIEYPKNRYEVIVTDNGSIDSTVKIATEFGARVLHESTCRVSGLRNRGAELSAGSILAFLDSDCSVEKDWLKIGMRYWNVRGVCAWGSPAVPPANATWVQNTWFLIRKKPSGVQDVDWLESMNLFIRKSDFVEVGGFGETLETCEDVDLCYRLKERGRIVSDADIKAIHYGEASTIREFTRKEIWRGASNFKGAFRHGFSPREIPSLFIPLYYGIFLPAILILTAIQFDPLRISLSLVLLLCPVVGVLIKAKVRIGGLVEGIRLFVLLQTYFLCRTFAVVIMPKRSNRREAKYESRHTE